jgi:hypothetical protein
MVSHTYNIRAVGTEYKVLANINIVHLWRTIFYVLRFSYKYFVPIGTFFIFSSCHFTNIIFFVCIKVPASILYR